MADEPVEEAGEGRCELDVAFIVTILLRFTLYSEWVPATGSRLIHQVSTVNIGACMTIYCIERQKNGDHQNWVLAIPPSGAV
jgi:hypothetical protein